MLNKEQIESIYIKQKEELINLISKKKRAKSYDVEKEIIQEIEKLNIEITLFEVILEKQNMKNKKELEEKRYELEKKIKYTEINSKAWHYLRGQFDFLNWLEEKEEE